MTCAKIRQVKRKLDSLREHVFLISTLVFLEVSDLGRVSAPYRTLLPTTREATTIPILQCFHIKELHTSFSPQVICKLTENLVNFRPLEKCADSITTRNCYITLLHLPVPHVGNLYPQEHLHCILKLRYNWKQFI